MKKKLLACHFRKRLSCSIKEFRNILFIKEFRNNRKLGFIIIAIYTTQRTQSPQIPLPSRIPRSQILQRTRSPSPRRLPSSQIPKRPLRSSSPQRSLQRPLSLQKPSRSQSPQQTYRRERLSSVTSSLSSSSIHDQSSNLSTHHGILKPVGSSKNICKILHLDKRIYQGYRSDLRDLIKAGLLDSRKKWKDQDSKQILTIIKRFKEKNPLFPKCINDWAIKEMARSIINNKREYSRDKRKISHKRNQDKNLDNNENDDHVVNQNDDNNNQDDGDNNQENDDNNYNDNQEDDDDNHNEDDNNNYDEDDNDKDDGGNHDEDDDDSHNEDDDDSHDEDDDNSHDGDNHDVNQEGDDQQQQKVHHQQQQFEEMYKKRKIQKQANRDNNYNKKKKNLERRSSRLAIKKPIMYK